MRPQFPHMAIIQMRQVNHQHDSHFNIYAHIFHRLTFFASGKRIISAENGFVSDLPIKATHEKPWHGAMQIAFACHPGIILLLLLLLLLLLPAGRLPFSINQSQSISCEHFNAAVSTSSNYANQLADDGHPSHPIRLARLIHHRMEVSRIGGVRQPGRTAAWQNPPHSIAQ